MEGRTNINSRREVGSSSDSITNQQLESQQEIVRPLISRHSSRTSLPLSKEVFGSIDIDECEWRSAQLDTTIIPTPFPAVQEEEMVPPNHPSSRQQGFSSNSDPMFWNTVEDAWASVQNGDDETLLPQQNMDVASQNPPSFEGMTIEDFFTLAGVGREQQGDARSMAPPQHMSQLGMNQNFDHLPHQHNFAARPQLVDSGGCVNSVFANHPVSGGVHAPLAVGYGGEYTSLVAEAGASARINRINERKRRHNVAQKKVEVRNPKSIINNRVSAERWRFRKQIYIDKLEDEWKLLTQENISLKKSLAESKKETQQQQMQCDEKETAGEDEIMGSVPEKIKAIRRSLSYPH